MRITESQLRSLIRSEVRKQYSSEMNEMFGFFKKSSDKPKKPEPEPEPEPVDQKKANYFPQEYSNTIYHKEFMDWAKSKWKIDDESRKGEVKHFVISDETKKDIKHFIEQIKKHGLSDWATEKLLLDMVDWKEPKPKPTWADLQSVIQMANAIVNNSVSLNESLRRVVREEIARHLTSRR